MLTFFTTFRNFSLAERNAISSWLALDHSTEVIVFTETSPVDPLLIGPKVRIISEFKRHTSGLPLINDLFDQASKLTGHALLCYLNSDIILLKDFKHLVATLLKETNPFLAVSQRIDLDLTTSVDFMNPESVANILQRIQQEGKIHPPTGSDIFIFPRFQYNSANIPDLVVGRPGWDLWMLYNARLRFNRLIDMTVPAPIVIHQNHLNKYNLNRPEDQMNMVFLPAKDKYTFVLKYCNFHIVNESIRKTRLVENTLPRIRWELEFARGRQDYYYFLAYFYFLTLRNGISKIGILNTIFKKTILKRLKRLLFFLRQDKIKFNVGSGGISADKKWYATDIKTLDITKESDWRRMLFFLKVDNIMAEHVWEHLTDNDTEIANRNCFKYLKSGGTLRLAVPDGFNPDLVYIEHVRPGGSGPGADDHKVLYNYKLMKERLEKAGFKVTLLEYWDEHGEFHFVDWTDDNGRINRSRRYDARNKDGKLGYTSLILDAVKP
jgi:predicted SAM-dependent methyltransferase